MTEIDRAKARKRFVIWAACILAACLLLEGAAFQYDALRTRGLTPVALSPETAQITREELPAEIDDVQAVMPSTAERGPLVRTTMTWEGLELTGICTAAVELTGESRLLRVRFLLSDDSYRYGFAAADSALALPGETVRARVEAHGALRRLQIIFETEDDTAALASLTLNTPVPYHFSLLRLLALLLPAWGIAAVLCLGLWRIPLDRRRAAHRLAYGLTALFCALLVLATGLLCAPADREEYPYTRALEYPFENDDVYRYRSLTHAVMYDMLAKGSVAVDVPPDEALLALENPYDPTARLESGAPVMFDYALYEGQYYAYFGLTPVLTFYAPYRLVMGYLPSYTTAAAFFALLTVAAAFLCVWEAVRRFVRTPSLLLTCLAAAAVALGGNALMLQASADRYHLSIACMQAFFYLTLWTALLACRQKKGGRRALLFWLCAICTALLVESRPMGALAAAGWLVPLFIAVLTSKKRTAAQKARDAAAYLVPLAWGAAAVMAYNAVRFGSPFEFGQTWQLTLEDIRQNRFSLRGALQALYYYYFDGLRLSPEFPFFTLGDGFINHTGNWFYGVANAGAFTMPVTWGLLWLAALPEKRRRGKLAAYLCAVLVTVPLSLAGYCVAGVAQRYVCDILPTLCLVGALTLTEIAGRDAAEGRGHTAALAAALMSATALIGCCLAFGNYRNFISQYRPEAYLYLHNLFSLL